MSLAEQTGLHGYWLLSRRDPYHLLRNTVHCMITIISLLKSVTYNTALCRLWRCTPNQDKINHRIWHDWLQTILSIPTVVCNTSVGALKLGTNILFNKRQYSRETVGRFATTIDMIAILFFQYRIEDSEVNYYEDLHPTAGTIMTKNMEKDLYEQGNILYTDSFSVRTWDGKSDNSTVIAGGRGRADR